MHHLAGVNNPVMEVMLLAISLSPIDFGCPQHGGLRTTKTQSKLYTSGKSKCDGRINKSNHQSGNSADVFAYGDGKASWEPEHLTLIAVYVMYAANILGYKCEWGGTWVSNGEIYGWDMAHFNITEK